MSEPPRKRQRMTPLQKEKILHYFHLNKEFSQNDSIQNDQWRRYAADLNKLGLSKSVKQWKTTWRRLRKRNEHGEAASPIVKNEVLSDGDAPKEGLTDGRIEDTVVNCVDRGDGESKEDSIDEKYNRSAEKITEQSQQHIDIEKILVKKRSTPIQQEKTDFNTRKKKSDGAILTAGEKEQGTFLSSPFYKKLTNFCMKAKNVYDSTMCNTEPFSKRLHNYCKNGEKLNDMAVLKLDKEVVFDKFENLAKTTTSLADKILEIEMRTTWERYFYKEHVDTRVNVLINDCLNDWKAWSYGTSDSDSPLVYKCNICQKGWWHLWPFREHVNTHYEDETLKIHLELCDHECNVIAYNDKVPKHITFPIDGRCWRCGNNYYFHNISKKINLYKCTYCNSNFNTCSLLNEHMELCTDYITHLEVENPGCVKWFLCRVCAAVKATTQLLKEHCTVYHSVRSDVPASTETNQCPDCNQHYSSISLHWCPKNTLPSKCNICVRRFPSPSLRSLHKKNTAVNYQCRVCKEVLPHQCLEAKHIAKKHSENYLVLPKCVLCVEHVVFLNKKSKSSHFYKRHKERYTQRKYGLEVVVPKSCVYGEQQWLSNFEDLDSATTRSSDVEGMSSDSIALQSNSRERMNTNSSSDDLEQVIVESIFGNFVVKDESTNSNEGKFNMDVETITLNSQQRKDVEEIHNQDIITLTLQEKLDFIKGKKKSDKAISTVKEKERGTFHNSPFYKKFSNYCKEAENVNDTTVCNVEPPKRLHNYCKNGEKLNDISVYKLNKMVVFDELENLAKTTTSLADKILEIEMRNTWGRYFYEEHVDTRVNVLINDCLNEWKAWSYGSSESDPPLVYKCNICQKGWWHLWPFREHVNTHYEDETLKIHLELCDHECNVIAYNDKVPKHITFPIDGRCWRCGNNYCFHNISKKINLYKCTYCNSNFNTCSLLNEHMELCTDYITHLEVENPGCVKWFLCRVCAAVKATTQLLEEHCTVYHSVRSDVPASTETNQCPDCNQRYSSISLHWCPKNTLPSKCNICVRRFPSPSLRSLHKKNTAVNYQCRVCKEVLPHQCLEAKHIAKKHSDNYLVLPKCVLCVEHVVFLNKKSKSSHFYKRHKERYTQRKYGLEVLVPKSCVYGKLQRLSNFEDLDSATSKPSDPGGLPLEDSIAQEPNSKKQQIIIKDIVGNVVDQNWNESTNSNNMNLTTISPESQAAVVYPSTIGPGVALIICNALNNLEDIHKNTNNSLGKFNVDIQMVAQELQQRQAAELNSSTTDFPAEVNNEPLDEKMDE